MLNLRNCLIAVRQTDYRYLEQKHLQYRVDALITMSLILPWFLLYQDISIVWIDIVTVFHFLCFSLIICDFDLLINGFSVFLVLYEINYIQIIHGIFNQIHSDDYFDRHWILRCYYIAIFIAHPTSTVQYLPKDRKLEVSYRHRGLISSVIWKLPLFTV